MISIALWTRLFISYHLIFCYCLNMNFNNQLTFTYLFGKILISDFAISKNSNSQYWKRNEYIRVSFACRFQQYNVSQVHFLHELLRYLDDVCIYVQCVMWTTCAYSAAGVNALHRLRNAKSQVNRARRLRHCMRIIILSSIVRIYFT